MKHSDLNDMRCHVLEDMVFNPWCSQT